METSEVMTNKGQRIGYRRVSTADQHTDRQLEGVALDRCFEDHATGKNTDRPGLQSAMDWARAGDTLVVWSMDRLGRSTRDMLRIIDDLTAKGVSIEFVKEHLTFRGDDSPMNRLILTVLSAVYECELGHIRERQREGVALAKKAGRYRGRLPAIRTGNGKAAELAKLIEEKVPVAEIARRLNVSRQTVYSNMAAAKQAVGQAVAA
jgi:DNA invertase Pin-like site-specific DNA recombinase